MTTVLDHADTGLALLTADPLLTVFDSKVEGGASQYVLVYTFRERPSGLVAPDKIALDGRSITVEMRMYCHCVGETAEAARWVADHVEAALLDVVPVVAGRTCFPIRWLEGQQARRDEETLQASFDLVDVYGWTSLPG